MERMRNSTRRMWVGLLGLSGLAAVVLATPAEATTFSFGTINASDEIASVILAPKSGGTPLVSFDSVTGVMTFQADVDEINLVGGGTINVASGTVEFSMSTVSLIGGSELFAPNPFPSFVAGEFANGMTFDFAITDIAGGSTVMLEGEFLAPILWTAQQLFFGVVNGNLDGDFSVVGGDGDFVSAWNAPEGSFDAQMSSFLAGGLPVNQACELTSSFGTAGLACAGLPADGFTSWTSNPVVTLQPTAIPEPSQGALAIFALGALAACRMKR